MGSVCSDTGGKPGQHTLTATIQLHPSLGAVDVHPSVLIAAVALPSLQVHWVVPSATVSGIAVAGLSLSNENYKPFKGVRTLARSGDMRVRMASILTS